MPKAFVDPDRAPRAAFVLDDAHPAGPGVRHRHARGQLVHAAEGVVTVTTPEGRWVAPPARAVWVPGGVPHTVGARRPFRLRTLYVTPGFAPLPRVSQVVAVDRLVAALLATAATFGADYPPSSPEARLVRVLLDRLPALTVAPLLHLPTPQGGPLGTIARALTKDPADERTLESWAAALSTTPRTLARRFLAETGLSFGRWRQQHRLLTALELLGTGHSVTDVALAVGYQDVSSFIARFKAATGVTPARYFAP